MNQIGNLRKFDCTRGLRAPFLWLASSIVLLVSVPAAAQLPPTPRDGAEVVPAGPQLVVADRFQNMGAMYEGDRIEVMWILENEGEEELSIHGTRTSCGCTVARLEEDQRMIAPGESLELVVEFDSTGRPGTQRKDVVVESDDPDEPRLKLEFEVDVESLYYAKPRAALNVHMVQRGETPRKDVEFRPASTGQMLEVFNVEVPPGVPLSVEREPLEGESGTRLIFHFSDQAPLGPIRADLVAHLRIGEVERAHEFIVQGEVVADLVWQPRVVDVTRHESSRGKRLAPITISAAGEKTFEIIKVGVDDVLDAQVEPVKSVRTGTRYRCNLAIRDDAPDGPFASEVVLHTSSFDQPLIRIPVYGNVAPRCAVDPPVVLFRQDGTTIGARRRLRIQCDPRTTLTLQSAKCTNDAVEIYEDALSSAKYRHIRFIEAFLSKELPAGIHEAVLVLETTVAGAQRIEVPVRIEVPN